MFLLDTDVVSSAQKKKLPSTITRWLMSQTRVAIPFPVFLEIERGIIEIKKTNASRAVELIEWRDGLLETEFDYPAITHDVARTLAAMMTCGALKNFWFPNPNASKSWKPSQDLFIAAIAIAHGLPIATLNSKDYLRIHRAFPLPGVFSPAWGEWLIKPVGSRDVDLVKAEIETLDAA